MPVSGKQAQEWIKPALYIGGGLLAWKHGIAPLLETFGLKDSQADKDILATENLPTNQDYWSPNFFRLPTPQGTKGNMLLTSSSVASSAKAVKDSLGGVTWVPGPFLIPVPIPKDDDEEAIYGLFRSIKYKTQISYLADFFYRTYKTDMYQYIKNYFNTSEMATLLAITNKKPWGFIRSNDTIY